MSSIAKSVSTVGELREFLKGIPGDTLLMFEETVCMPRLVIHFTEKPERAMQVCIWSGEELEEVPE